MGIELAKAYVRVRGDSTHIQADLAEIKDMVGNALDHLENKSENVMSGLSRGLQDARTYAAGLLKVVDRIGSSFLEQGIAAAAFHEDTTVALQRMIGDAEKTKKFMGELSDFAEFTPFEMPQLLNVAKQMINARKSTEETMETIKLLGDASGGTSENFQILSLVMQQIEGVGHLLTEDFRQLSTRGILSAQDFIDAGIAPTVQAFQEMKSKGQISMEDVMTAIRVTTQEGGRNFEAMIQASKTMTGRTSTLSDAVGILGRKVAESIVPVRKIWIDMKIAAVEAMAAVVQGTDGAAGAAFVGAVAFAKLGAAILGANVALKMFKVSMTKVLLGSGIGIAVLALGAAVGFVAQKFAVAEKVMDAVSTTVSNLLPNWEVLKEAIVELGDSVLFAFEEVFGKTVGDVMDDAIGYVADFISFFGRKIQWAASYTAWLAGEISYHIRNGFDLGRIALIDLQIAMLEFFGVTDEEAAVWSASLMGAWEGLTAFFTAWADNIVALFKIAIAGMKGEITRLVEFADAILSGDSLETAMDKAQKARDEAMKGADLDLVDPFSAFTEARNKAIDEAMEDFAESGGPIEQMKKEREALEQQIAERESRFRDRKAPEDEGKEDDDKEDDKEKEEAEGKGDFGLKAGRFGFAQFGDKIQDAALKAEDKQGQMLDVMKAQEQIQKDILAENQKDKKGGMAK